MADTLPNIPIPGEDWQDFYGQAKIPRGAPVSVQNIGTTDLYYSTQIDKPPVDHKAYRIFRRGETIFLLNGDTFVWVFSVQVAGLVNVEILDTSSTLDLIQAQLLKNSEQNGLILNELILLNERFEAAFETTIQREDVGECS